MKTKQLAKPTWRRRTTHRPKAHSAAIIYLVPLSSESVTTKCLPKKVSQFLLFTLSMNLPSFLSYPPNFQYCSNPHQQSPSLPPTNWLRLNHRYRPLSRGKRPQAQAQSLRPYSELLAPLERQGKRWIASTRLMRTNDLTHHAHPILHLVH
jgi:hypothetical protein